MGIEAKIKGDLDGIGKALLNEVEAQILETLNHVGEEAVKMAREDHARNWQDQTGNLRSSVGYVVFKDGKPVRSSAFDTIPPKDPKAGTEYTGAAQGQELAAKVGAEHTEGYALVVVAGMHYAVYVEANGRDVLTGAEKYAEKQIAREMADLVKNIKDAFA